MVASTRSSSPWARRSCGILFWSGFIVAGVLIVLHGVRGMLVGYCVWAVAWAAAMRADPSKWSR